MSADETAPLPLVDTFGRQHTDLRISVTDRCNFRCTYCMPEEGMQWLPREDVLTYEEIERIARVARDRFGFRTVRITGGEPLMRAHLPVLIDKLSALGLEVALTTNGATLAGQAEALAQAGLARINISLDSLRPDRFAALTRRDALGSVVAGIDAAIAAGLAPVKINCVLVRGENDDEIIEFARFGRSRGVMVRFIEFMPLDATAEWTKRAVVSEAEVVAAISGEFPVAPIERGHDPARGYRYLDGQGGFGVIGSVTEPFCASCDRVRLSADGHLRACLFSHDETDLRPLLRGQADDKALADLLAETVRGKWAGHQIGQVQFVRPAKSMSQIGG